MSLTTILLNTSIVLARYLPYILGVVTLITSIFILKREKIGLCSTIRTTDTA